MSPEPWTDARTRLTAANLGVPIEWPNEPFAQPDPPSPWLAVESTGDVLQPIEMGGGIWQEEGHLYVHVLAPAMSGTDAARALAKQVANVFRGIGPNNTRYRGASIGAGQVDEPAGTVWRLTVVVDWVYQDTPATS